LVQIDFYSLSSRNTRGTSEKTMRMIFQQHRNRFVFFWFMLVFAWLFCGFPQNRHANAAAPYDDWWDTMYGSRKKITVNPGTSINSVQTGTTTIPVASQSATVNITAVDRTKAFLVFGVSENSDVPTDAQISGQITANNQLTFSRFNATPATAVTIKWYVAEFTSGVTVQRGSANLADQTQISATIESVDTTKSFPLISYRIDGSILAGDDFVKAKILDATTLELRVQEAAATAGAIAEWQVVEFTGSSVLSGDTTIAAGNTSEVYTRPSGSWDLSRSWLIYTYSVGSGDLADIGQKLVRGRFTANNQLTFDRDHDNGTNTEAVNITWYVVEFTDGTNVQSGNKSFGTGDTSLAQAINNVDTARAIASGGFFGRGGQSSYASADNPGVGWFALDLTSSTNLQITRGLMGSSTADVGWFVLEFPPPTDVPSGYSVSVTFDHEAMVSQGSAQADGDDVRVAYWNGATWTALDRVLDPLSSWDDVATKIWFKTQAIINASSSDDNYYIYYDNSSASNPPDDWANVFMVGDDFNDGILTSGITTSTAGTASISETGGEAFIDLGTDENADAGILVSTNTLPDDKKFVIRHKTKLVSGGGISDPEFKGIGIGKSAGTYGVDTNTNENPRRRIISFIRADDSWAQIYYYSAFDFCYHWDGTAWQTGNGFWDQGNLSLNTYYIHELISDGTEWYVRISEADGTVLTITTPIAWANTYDTSNDLWFYWGEIYTNFYYADVKSDWVYVRQYIDPEPTTSMGNQECNLGYSYRRSIKIDGDEVGGSSGYMTDFPALVDLSGSWLQTAPAGDIKHASGWDIIFRGLDDTTCNGTAPCDLDFEIETYDGSTGKLVAWVRVPQVYAGDSDPGNDTVIYMYYGSACVTSDPQNATAVWDSNYKGVWHLAEKYGLNFDGTTSYVDSGYNTHHTQTTIEAWIYPETWGENSMGRVVDKREGVNDALKLFIYGAGNPPNHSLTFERKFSAGSGYEMWATPADSIVLNTWQHVAVTYDDSDPANEPSIYINGQLQTLTPIMTGSGTAVDTTDDYIIGNRGAGDMTFDGIIDDLRIYSRILTSDEINDRYLGKREPSRDGLVIEYLMDEGSGTSVSDSSGNSHHGDMTGHAAAWVRSRMHDSTGNSNIGKRRTLVGAPAEKINGCDAFDGSDDSFRVEDYQRLDMGTSDFTLEAWAKLTPSSEPYPTIIFKGAGSNGEAGYWLFSYDDTPSFVRFTIGDGSTRKNVNSDIDIEDDQWHHVVAVADRSGVDGTLSMYIDGDPHGQTNYTGFPGSIDSGYDWFLISASATTANWVGNLDEVRVTSGIRSAEWVETEANNQQENSTFFTLGSEEPVNSLPSAPTELYSNNNTAQSGQTNPIDITDTSPAFSAIYNDPDPGDIANKYRVEVNTQSDFNGTVMWDSGASGTAMTDTTEGNRCPDIIYAGAALQDATTYYWRIRFWDDSGAAGVVATGQFTTTTLVNTAPAAPTTLYSNNITAQIGRTNPTGINDPTPAFSAIYNESDPGDIANKYRVEVNTQSDFNGTVMWDSGAPGTAMADTTAGNRCPDIIYAGAALQDATTYYWRIRFWDDRGGQGASASGQFTTSIVGNGDTAIYYTQWAPKLRPCIRAMHRPTMGC
jgi:hypothetical protein